MSKIVAGRINSGIKADIQAQIQDRINKRGVAAGANTLMDQLMKKTGNLKRAIAAQRALGLKVAQTVLKSRQGLVKSEQGILNTLTTLQGQYDALQAKSLGLDAGVRDRGKFEAKQQTKAAKLAAARMAAVRGGQIEPDTKGLIEKMGVGGNKASNTNWNNLTDVNKMKKVDAEHRIMGFLDQYGRYSQELAERAPALRRNINVPVNRLRGDPELERITAGINTMVQQYFQTVSNETRATDRDVEPFKRHLPKETDPLKTILQKMEQAYTAALSLNEKRQYGFNPTIDNPDGRGYLQVYAQNRKMILDGLRGVRKVKKILTRLGEDEAIEDVKRQTVRDQMTTNITNSISGKLGKTAGDLAGKAYKWASDVPGDLFGARGGLQALQGLAPSAAYLRMAQVAEADRRGLEKK